MSTHVEGNAPAVRWRVVMSPPMDGARQMALDLALLEQCAADPAAFVPLLRLYSFDPPCLSLGRFQPVESVDPAACERFGIDVVRRPSGGRAVLHDRDLTYALVADEDSAPFAGGVRASAGRIGEALAMGLRRLGIDVALAPAPARGRHAADCFAAPDLGEVVADGRKLVGSAQVRRSGVALQHGTVRLRADAGIAARVLRGGEIPAAVPPQTAALDALCGRPVTFTEAAGAVLAGFGETFGVTFLGVSFRADDVDRVADACHLAPTPSSSLPPRPLRRGRLRSPPSGSP